MCEEKKRKNDIVQVIADIVTMNFDEKEKFISKDSLSFEEGIMSITDKDYIYAYKFRLSFCSLVIFKKENNDHYFLNVMSESKMIEFPNGINIYENIDLMTSDLKVAKRFAFYHIIAVYNAFIERMKDDLDIAYKGYEEVS